MHILHAILHVYVWCMSICLILLMSQMCSQTLSINNFPSFASLLFLFCCCLSLLCCAMLSKAPSWSNIYVETHETQQQGIQPIINTNHNLHYTCRNRARQIIRLTQIKQGKYNHHQPTHCGPQRYTRYYELR